MKKLFFVFMAVIFLAGCGNNSNNKRDNTLNEIIASNNYIVVDVRTEDEYEVLHVKDSINIPLQEIDDEIDLDKSKKILVYCMSGARSKSAASKLQSLGYDVFDLGGIDSVDLEKE